MYLAQYIMGCTNHGHCVGGQQLLRRHGGEVCDVGQGVDQRHQGDGDVDRPGQVPGQHQRSDYWSLIGHYRSLIKHYWSLIGHYWSLLRRCLSRIKHCCSLITQYWSLIRHYWSLINHNWSLIEHYWSLIYTIINRSVLMTDRSLSITDQTLSTPWLIMSDNWFTLTIILIINHVYTTLSLLWLELLIGIYQTLSINK